MIDLGDTLNRRRQINAVWRELDASSKKRGGMEVDLENRLPVGLTRGWNLNNPDEQQLARGFQRGRIILNQISSPNDPYWELSYPGLYSPLDTKAPNQLSNRERRMGHTIGLLGLIGLSRAVVDLDVPNRVDVSNLVEIEDEMRSELGVQEHFRALVGVNIQDLREATQAERLDEFEYTHPFPGVTGAQVVDAVLGGTLRVGNSEQILD